MSSTVPITASCSSTINLPPPEMSGNRLFQFYMQSFFRMPKDLKNDIIYCQRALKAHIKVHQMVIDVFQQQPDADPQQKKRILYELESEIYEINAEQQFLFLRLRRIIDEFFKMLNHNGIQTNLNITNTIISKDITPLINDNSVEILPSTIVPRYTEEKLIEKYFEVQKDQQEPQQQQQRHHQHNQDLSNMEVIDIIGDGNVLDKVAKVHGKYRGIKREYPSSSGSSVNSESLLRNFNVGFNAVLSQTSLLKPMNQRMPHELMTMDIKPTVSKSTPTTLADIYKQNKEEKEKLNELPVSTNVTLSRMNLREALKRAQVAARGPVSTVTKPPTPPPPPPPPAPPAPPAPQVAKSKITDVPKKSTAKPRGKRAAKNSRKEPAAKKSPERIVSYIPDRFLSVRSEYLSKEIHNNAEDYGCEMFLRFFDILTPDMVAQLQQRHSKRLKRSPQNTNYHYGNHVGYLSSNDEPMTTRKRKLLTPAVKKKSKPRAKRRSTDKSNSAPTSRSESSSPDDKRLCNYCLKSDYNLDQCEECKQYYHVKCHHEIDDSTQMKICPECKRKQDKVIQEKITTNKNLQCNVQELELQLAKEKDRREILERTGKSYKIQMNTMFKIVNALKTKTAVTPSTSSNSNNKDDVEDYAIIQLD